MTAAQKRKYFKMWGIIRRQLRTAGYTPSEADEMRHEITEAALGGRKSSKDFTNLEVTKVFREMERHMPAPNLSTQMKSDDDLEREELIASCRNKGYPDTYIEALAASPRFKSDDWQNMRLKDLRALRLTLEARRRSKEKKARELSSNQRELA